MKPRELDPESNSVTFDPSARNGIFASLSYGDWRAGRIMELSGISYKHLKAIAAGDQDVRNIYLQPDPSSVGRYVIANNCMVVLADPTNDHNTMIRDEIWEHTPGEPVRPSPFRDIVAA
jgi:hypothetical protein